jgi:A/G-specific adenine glycosylase
MLAQAERTAVLQHWQGLGYNNRAVRLHTIAKLKEELPKTREELLKLPGVGPYTAGALMIFAHDVPEISVDVNVDRVLRRVFFDPALSPKKEDIEQLSFVLIAASKQPRNWHAALMDLGSAICTARLPICAQCPLLSACRSRGVRPDEKKIKSKQSRFIGSKRWWRGQILKLLLRGPTSKNKLLHVIKENPSAEDADLCEAALADMIREDLVVSEKQTLKLR